MYSHKYNKNNAAAYKMPVSPVPRVEETGIENTNRGFYTVDIDGLRNP